MSPIVVTMLGTLAAALAVMLAAFAFGAATGRHRGVDVAWGLGFAAVALTGLVLSGGHGDPATRWLVTASVTPASGGACSPWPACTGPVGSR